MTPQKRKYRTKRWIVYVLFVLLLALTIYVLTAILEYNSPHGINQAEGIYCQPEDTIDVVMLGTSHVHCDINTALLWEQYQIAAYDYSGAEQPLWMTYYYLKELYKTQSPQLIVLDLYAPARFKEDYQYDWIDENIWGMKFSPNKLEMLLTSTQGSRLFDYFPAFMSYHYRYKELKAEDFNHFFQNAEDRAACKGYTPYFGITEVPKPAESVFEGVTDPDSTYQALTAKSEQYLRKMIEYAKKQGSEILLVSAPYLVTAEDEETYLAVEKLAEEYQVDFIDYNRHYEEMGLDFATDFNDESHLNYAGSCKYTRLLGEHIAPYLEAADKDLENPAVAEAYATWDRHAELIREAVKEDVKQ